MKHKKNIDDLFKEQLSSFEATPSPEVWKHIEAQLKKEKEDRKIIPIWWKLGGVAAVLAILLTVSDVFKSNEILDDNNTIVEENTNKSENNTLNNTEESVLNNLDKTTDAIVTENQDSENDKFIDNSEKLNSDKLINNTENAVSTTEKSQVKKDSKKKASVLKNTTVKDGVAISTTTKTNKKESNSFLKEAGSKDKIVSEKEVNSAVAKVEKTNAEKIPSEKEEKIISPNTTGESIAIEDITEKTEKDIQPANKKSIFDAIEENKDSEVAKKDDKKSNPYWEVTPNVGPVYYNSINGGSSISSSFADNPQSGDTNISYGVQVSYNVNDRLSVRTGINNVSLGYATGDVVLATSPTEVALKSITYESGGRTVLTAFDKGSLENLPTDPNNPFSQVTLKSTSGNAEIIQNISYYEVPMELKYALVNNRFGINMIGGFSTLFLGNNEISVTDGEFRSVLGEANNLNSMSFSTNIGLGFDYKISKRFKFNIEPIFKYQLNPYSTSVDFNPYYFGIYSGLSFKF
ncbi:PorT family protein [Aureisphaera sp. CAU 1614]|uniref:PorT family protein n=1 Tax=Halomarinibacterium sedimenti TaxID=2857106 RepID=A0A9X1FMA9_9FLAO|nr:outer membrane beta-barrel protein [Halomarinibacterium sedimenti]MBW2937196.1 PorT family protein [Halomarinibacterium sedimenti]